MAQEELPEEVDELAELGLPPELERVPGQPKHCVHTWVWLWSGKCENCKLVPLSAVHVEDRDRSDQKEPDAA
jgi:hypothetical protein